MQKRTKKILEQLAKELGITPKEAEFAVQAFYKETKRLLEEGDPTDFKSMNLVNIYKFTRFVPRTTKLRLYNERRKEQHEYFIQGIQGGGDHFKIVQY